MQIEVRVFSQRLFVHLDLALIGKEENVLRPDDAAADAQPSLLRLRRLALLGDRGLDDLNGMPPGAAMCRGFSIHHAIDGS